MIIDNVPFSQPNPSSTSPRNNPSLATQQANQNDELTNIENTLIEGYITENNQAIRVSTSSFTVSGDQSLFYTDGRIIRINGSIYTVVSGSSYNSGTGLTTVTTYTTVVPNPINSLDIGIMPKGIANKFIADILDGFHASATAAANVLLALNSSSKLPGNVVNKNSIDTGNSFGNSNKPLLNYIVRAPSSSTPDYVWTDTTWSTKSLQSIVGTTAVRVKLRAQFGATAAGRAHFTKGGTFTNGTTTGNSLADPRQTGLYNQVVGSGNFVDANVAEIEVDLDASQQIQFLTVGMGAIQSASIQVIGWYEPAGV